MKKPNKPVTPILSAKKKKVDIAPFVFAEPKTEYDKDDKIGPFLEDLLGFTGQLHRFHLNTKSHARHIVLDEAYKGLPEKIDQLAESYMADDPDCKIYKMSHEEFETPEELLNHIKDYANGIKVDCRCIDNALDDLVMFVSGIIYKLRMY